jgi:hypothetical protein
MPPKLPGSSHLYQPVAAMPSTRRHPFFQLPLLSVLLLLLANMAFGLFLHEDYGQSYFVWGAAIVYIVLECSALSIAWRPTRNFLLLGFKSDVGYSLMALAGASFAVVLLAWIRISSYFFGVLAAALLLRINLHTRRGGAVVSFLVMLSISLLGLAMSWLPTLAKAGQLPF